MKLRAYAKINLGLDVIRRREDGYHEVKMIMQTVDLYDQLILEKTEKPGIQLTTDAGFIPVNEDNLVYRAARLLMEQGQVEEGIRIHLEKRIPVAAGMAGGSSDAAMTLVGVNRIFGLGLSQKELMELGVKIGADVPYCILGGTALSEGIGEILTSLPPMPDCHILIGKPDISVSTKFVYTHLKLDEDTSHPDIDGMSMALKEKNLIGITERMENVLEQVTIPAYPVIAAIKRHMKAHGALNALMSGSGPTVFGIFDQEEKAKAAYEALVCSGLTKQTFLTTAYNNGGTPDDE